MRIRNDNASEEDLSNTFPFLTAPTSPTFTDDHSSPLETGVTSTNSMSWSNPTSSSTTPDTSSYSAIDRQNQEIVDRLYREEMEGEAIEDFVLNREEDDVLEFASVLPYKSIADDKTQLTDFASLLLSKEKYREILQMPSPSPSISSTLFPQRDREKMKKGRDVEDTDGEERSVDMNMSVDGDRQDSKGESRRLERRDSYFEQFNSPIQHSILSSERHPLNAQYKTYFNFKSKWVEDKRGNRWRLNYFPEASGKQNYGIGADIFIEMDPESLEYKDEEYLRRNVHITFELLKISYAKQGKKRTTKATSTTTSNTLSSKNKIENDMLNDDGLSPKSQNKYENKYAADYQQVQKGKYQKSFKNKLINYVKSNDQFRLTATNLCTNREFDWEYILHDKKIDDRGLFNVFTHEAINQQLLDERRRLEEDDTVEDEDEGQEEEGGEEEEEEEEEGEKKKLEKEENFSSDDETYEYEEGEDSLTTKSMHTKRDKTRSKISINNQQQLKVKRKQATLSSSSISSYTEGSILLHGEKIILLTRIEDVLGYNHETIINYGHLYNSRLEVNRVGIYNQSCTCYLNSLIQSLWHIPLFRTIVYNIDFNKLTCSQNLTNEIRITSALQNLFQALETNPGAVSTRDLTEAFGWSDNQVGTQQDIQEFKQILLTYLENIVTMFKKNAQEREIENKKGERTDRNEEELMVEDNDQVMNNNISSKKENTYEKSNGNEDHAHPSSPTFSPNYKETSSSTSTSSNSSQSSSPSSPSSTTTNEVTDLMCGECLEYVKNEEFNFHSSTRCPFNDLQLDVENSPSLQDSFRDFLSSEKLTGPNQYVLEGKGKVDVIKGAKFSYLPPVLSLQLRRFKYDPIDYQAIKINNKFIFPNELDMSPYFPKPSTTTATSTSNSTFPSESQKKGEKTSHTNLSSNENENEHAYILHSILVHRGSSAGGGHYYAYIRDLEPYLNEGDSYLKSGKGWLKFDDEHVSRVAEEIVYEDSYGKDHDNVPLSNWHTYLEEVSTAYMLVYIQKSRMKEIYHPPTPTNATLQLQTA